MHAKTNGVEDLMV